jgi:hypothetical protein
MIKIKSRMTEDGILCSNGKISPSLENNRAEFDMKRCAQIALVLMTIILITGLFPQCSSNRWVVTSRNVAPDRHEYDISVTATYLSEEDLVGRFTRRDNPYLPPNSLLGTSDMIVFEVTVQNRSSNQKPIVVPCESMRLIASDKSFVPVNRFQLTDFWKNFLDKSTTRDTRDYKSTGGKMGYVINRTMFDNPAELQSGDTYSGIVAFMGRFSRYGIGEISIPVFDAKDRAIGVFVEEFERY